MGWPTVQGVLCNVLIIQTPQNNSESEQTRGSNIWYMKKKKKKDKNKNKKAKQMIF
jgi:hypothetical protein